jgi:hypothetical protein
MNTTQLTSNLLVAYSGGTSQINRAEIRQHGFCEEDAITGAQENRSSIAIRTDRS